MMSTRKNPYVVFGRPVHDELEVQAVAEVIRSGWWGTGPVVADFEAQFASLHHLPATRVCALNSGTAALHLALLGAGVKPGDEVITTALTFCATVNAILHAGGKPVLVDVDPTTGCIDPDALTAAMTSKTRALLPVHLAGQICRMTEIERVAVDHGLAIVEDCAHATEAYRPAHPDVIRFQCFSFYTTKNVATAEGGMVLCPDTDAANRIRTLSLHGLSAGAHQRFSANGYQHYDVTSAGFKYNLTDILAAIGRVQLTRVEAHAQRRREIWQKYDAAFQDLDLDGPLVCEKEARHARHLYTRWLPRSALLTRDVLLSNLHEKGIGGGVHYQSLAEHSFYQQRFEWRPEQWPNACNIGRSTFSLPLGGDYTDTEIDRVIDAVREILAASL